MGGEDQCGAGRGGEKSKHRYEITYDLCKKKKKKKLEDRGGTRAGPKKRPLRNVVAKKADHL